MFIFIPVTGYKFPVTRNKFPVTGNEFPVTGNKYPVTRNKFPVPGNKNPVIDIQIFCVFPVIFIAHCPNGTGAISKLILIP